MFPERSACYMDLMPFHDDSLKESLKQTVLHQENMFRKQVRELHRLYQIQTVLMMDLRLKEVPSIQSVNYSKQDCRVNWSRYDQRTLGLEVPVNSYVSNFAPHFLKEGNDLGTRGTPVDVEDDFHGETESSLEETKLSLTIGRDSSQRMSGWRTQNEKVRSFVPQDIIELEESIRTTFSRDVGFESALRSVPCSAHSGEMIGWHPSCSCANSTKEYSSNRAILEPNSLNQGDKKGFEKLPETGSAVVRKLFSSHGAAAYLDLNSPQPDESPLDLTDHKMDCSLVAASSGVVIGELYNGTSPDSVNWTKLNDNCSTEVRPLNSISMVSTRTGSPNASGSKPWSIDLESYPVSSSDSGEEDHGCLGKAANSIRDFPSRNCKAETVAEVNGEKGDGVLVHSFLFSSGETVEDVVIDERSPALSKPDQIAHYPSSSLKTTQSGTNLERSFSRQNSNSSQVDSAAIVESKPDFPSRNCKDQSVTEVNGEKGDEFLVHSYLCSSGETVEDVIDERSPALSKPDQIAQDPSNSLKTMQSGTYTERSFSRMNSFQNSDSSHVDSSAIFEENGESANDDPVIQRGAASLAYFLLEVRREHEVKKTRVDEPERSMDSFELDVLNLQESNTEDYCVSSSSNPYEINDMDKKDCGIKLRRGSRRMKDFQKEILPSLPSLTRQEICEDIRIMEGAMRSREYKRSQSKITAEQKCCTPVRSRRSRLNCTGKRHYK